MIHVSAHAITTHSHFPTVSNIVLVSFTHCRTSALLILPTQLIFFILLHISTASNLLITIRTNAVYNDFVTFITQEGQHPLTGQRAANFKLLTNQWAERRLVTQCRHGCRTMRRSVCNAGASNGSRCLCVQISRERSYPLPIYWYHTKGNLIALQLCRWQFSYNETFQQTFRPLLSKLSKRPHKSRYFISILRKLGAAYNLGWWLVGKPV